MALEQRFMFDGAALVEAHAVLDSPDAGESAYAHTGETALAVPTGDGVAEEVAVV